MNRVADHIKCETEGHLACDMGTSIYFNYTTAEHLYQCKRCMEFVKLNLDDYEVILNE